MGPDCSSGPSTSNAATSVEPVAGSRAHDRHSALNSKDSRQTRKRKKKGGDSSGSKRTTGGSMYVSDLGRDRRNGGWGRRGDESDRINFCGTTLRE